MRHGTHGQVRGNAGISNLETKCEIFENCTKLLDVESHGDFQKSKSALKSRARLKTARAGLIKPQSLRKFRNFAQGLFKEI
jgi:hypothetical protein